MDLKPIQETLTPAPLLGERRVIGIPFIAGVFFRGVGFFASDLAEA